MAQRHAAAGQRGFDQGRVASDQHHCSAMGAHGRHQGCEILPLAFAAQDGHELALDAKTAQGGERRPYIGALAVVKILHTVDDSHGLHPVRLAAVFPQTIKHGRQCCACFGCQRQCRQCIAGVVAATDAQRVCRHQALQLHRRRCRRVLARPDMCFVFDGAHQPGHAVDSFQSEVPRALRNTAAKTYAASCKNLC